MLIILDFNIELHKHMVDLIERRQTKQVERKALFGQIRSKRGLSRSVIKWQVKGFAKENGKSPIRKACITSFVVSCTSFGGWGFITREEICRLPVPKICNSL